MFPGRFFPKSYFTGTYFPPVEGGLPPVPPPTGGTLHWATRRTFVTFDEDEEALIIALTTRRRP